MSFRKRRCRTRPVHLPCSGIDELFDGIEWGEARECLSSTGHSGYGRKLAGDGVPAFMNRKTLRSVSL